MKCPLAPEYTFAQLVARAYSHENLYQVIARVRREDARHGDKP